MKLIISISVVLFILSSSVSSAPVDTPPRQENGTKQEMDNIKQDAVDEKKRIEEKKKDKDLERFGDPCLLNPHLPVCGDL